MDTNRKQALIQEWGFIPVEHGTGLFERNIYANQGYTEYWEAHNPDVIQFYKGAINTENYTIDWALFN